MKKQYLHLSLILAIGASAVVSESLAVRETIKRNRCTTGRGRWLTCGHKQGKAGEADVTRRCPPVDWQPISALCL